LAALGGGSEREGASGTLSPTPLTRRIQDQLAPTGVRNALILLAAESAVAVFCSTAVVASLAAVILEDTDTLGVAALEALAALVIDGASLAVEAPLSENFLIAAPDLAPSFGADVVLGSRVPAESQPDQTDRQPSQGHAPVRLVAETARQGIELLTVHEVISSTAVSDKTGPVSHFQYYR
jgi:hypothetical protein